MEPVSFKLNLTTEDRGEMLTYYTTIPVDKNGRVKPIFYDEHSVRNDVIKLLVDTDLLVTTIESQKEQIDKLGMLCKECVDWLEEQGHPIAHYNLKTRLARIQEGEKIDGTKAAGNP
jgi:hypothetical protein